MNNYNIEYKLVNNLVVPPHEGGIDLMVVMPFYNEGESLAYVVGQWVEVLESSCPNYQIVLVADKPRDNSVEVAKSLIRENPKLVLLENSQNIGHGQSCLRGYTVAVSMGADWVLQVDSDGQCDPSYFPMLWKRRSLGDLHQGVRVRRCDGCFRWCASRLLELLVFVRTGKYLKDPNCPYRLMRGSILKEAVNKIPVSFDLANIALSFVFEKNNTPAKYFPIVFLNRYAGVPTVSFNVLAKKALQLWTNFPQIS